MTAKPPVFVVGSPRSGTTLLHCTLMSAGEFAIYRSETHAYNGLAPRYGHFGTASLRREFLTDWLESEHFLRTGLDPAVATRAVEEECRSAADFLRAILGRIAQQQQASRWLESTPESGLYIDQILRDFPDARIVHMLRDGRDVAPSMVRQGWFRPFPWHRPRPLLPAIAYWDWIVRRIRGLGQKKCANYCEVRFEDLTAKPGETLCKLSDFLQQRLDWEQIQKIGIGSVSKPNTSYTDDLAQGAFEPIGRWKRELTAEQVADLEAIAGPLLEDLGYERTSPERSARLTRWLYQRRFATRFWMKNHCPLARHLSHATIIPWEPQPPSEDRTLRPADNLEAIRQIVAGHCP